MDYNENNPYEPKQFDISGITIFGKRLKDGSILIGDKNETHLSDFPMYITICGGTYKLEKIDKNKDICNLSQNHEGYNIEWGIYC